ncbi:MAG: lysophospholipid acyltransferase family protein [Chloroflexi bacterium]|nr:lysophospholipid acyltransferase family protein [Chloroflexota bacterium]
MFKRAFNQTLAGYWMYRVLGAIVPLIPPKPGYRLFGWLGERFFDWFADARQPLRDNLRHVLPTAPAEEIDAIARNILRNHLKNYYDFFRSTRMSRADVARVVQVDGWENLERALSRGKGVIFVTAHFGNLDIVGQTFAIRGYRVTTPAEHVKPEVLYQRIVATRASKGLTIIPVDGPLLALVRALKKNEIVGLASDLDVTKSGMPVKFFDAPARLPDGHVQLALRTGAAVVPAFSVRLPDNRFAATAEPAIELQDTGDFSADVRAGVEQVVRRMEGWIARHPEQWVMFHRIWSE